MTIITNGVRKRFAFYAFMLLFSLKFAARGDQTITMAWDANTNDAVAGYRVYYGTNSGDYDFQLDVGTNTCATITNLQPGLTYYISTTDYDSDGWESDFSDEVYYLVPGVVKLMAGTSPDWPVTVSFPVEPDHWYELQASTDLKNWTTLWQTDVEEENDWVEFMDFDSPGMPQRYYRLSMH